MGLDMAREAIPPAIASAKMGVRSTHGFKSFFKDDSSSKHVVYLLQQIRDQTPLRGRQPNVFKASGPEFICVKKDTHNRYKQLHDDPFKTCSQEAVYGFWVRSSRFIFLCDFFFEQPISPPSTTSSSVSDTRPASTCLQVQDNSFVGSTNTMCLYQKYLLIHEMTHFYLGKNTLGSRTKPPEQYRMKQCIELDYRSSLRNPQNYQAFVASKSHLVIQLLEGLFKV